MLPAVPPRSAILPPPKAAGGRSAPWRLEPPEPAGVSQRRMVKKWTAVARPGVLRCRRPRMSEEVNYMRVHTRKYFINLPLINQIISIMPPI